MRLCAWSASLLRVFRSTLLFKRSTASVSASTWRITNLAKEQLPTTGLFRTNTHWWKTSKKTHREVVHKQPEEQSHHVLTCEFSVVDFEEVNLGQKSPATTPILECFYLFIYPRTYQSLHWIIKYQDWILIILITRYQNSTMAKWIE